MKRMIGWTCYIWLLASDASEQLIETVRERFLSRSSPEKASRYLRLGDRFSVSPPTAIR